MTINGTNLDGATAVSFNGTSAVIGTNTPTSITTTVPAGATDGTISVTTPGGTDTSPGSFNVTIPPVVTGFSPTSGPVGTSVTINGTDLTGATSVKFNGTAAAFAVDSSTQITTTVPAGATDGTISVTTPGGTDTSPGSFNVIPPPNVTGYSPTVGTTGTSVTINGTNLGSAISVTFNGTSAVIGTNTPTSITTTVPVGATTGSVSVTTPGGTDNGPSFTVDTTAPVLTLTPPGNRTVEADGPGGTRVSYTVSGSDDGIALLPGAVTCSPVSASVFPLGKTTVTCSAQDAVGNVATLSFDVTVVDTTAPSINAPDASFTATDASGISRSAPAVVAYLAGISASDIVSNATLTTTIPEQLPIGRTPDRRHGA